MSIKLSNLPYDKNALEPHVSAETLSYHYDKHHRGYVDKLNRLIKDTPFENLTLEEIISKARIEAKVDILNNAAQAWNHAFFWESMSPNGGARPDAQIKAMIEFEYRDIDDFKREFAEAALGLFGSGWVWLVLDRGRLRIITTGNADSPVGTHLVPLLTLDVWEHAYYLDYRNERKRYVETFLDKLINWKFAESNLVDLDSARAA